MPINNSVRGVASTEQHAHEVIATADPWAKLAAAPASDADQAPQAAPEPSSSSPAGGGAEADESWAIKISNLSFSYPGIGEYTEGGGVGTFCSCANARVRSASARGSRLTHTHIRARADGRPLEGVPPVVQDMTASLRPGSRCLLIGETRRNGFAFSALG